MLKERRLNIFVKQMQRLYTFAKEDVQYAKKKKNKLYVFSCLSVARMHGMLSVKILTEFQKTTLPLAGPLDSWRESPVEGMTEITEGKRRKKRKQEWHSVDRIPLPRPDSTPLKAQYVRCGHLLNSCSKTPPVTATWSSS